MGYDQIEVTEVVFDTGSSWLVLETVDCSSCSDAYDYSSQTDTYTEIGTAISQGYGDGTSVSGVLASDWVCPADDVDTCATDFVWMNVQNDGLESS